ncbi:MAG: hypothetical protein LAO31_22965 [Acidobacteriia bacterium]|nr:hypothetical protein [Terriglobia bacterium]
MKIAALILSLLPFLSLNAQDSTALVVQNLKIDAQKVTVDFDVVNQSTRPIRAWMMTVTTKKKKLLPTSSGEIAPPGGFWTANLLTTSESCREETTGSLAPGQSRHCSNHVEFGEPDATLLDASVRFTAVLFEDGTAEGDLKLIDSAIRKRQTSFRSVRYWQERFQEACKAPTPMDQLKTFEKMLSGSDPSVPQDMLYDSSAMVVRKSLQFQVSSLIQQVGTRGVDAGGMIQKLDGMIQQQVRQATESSRAFPPRDIPYGPADTAAAIQPIVNRTSSFHLIKTEQMDNQLRLVLRNDYDKEVVQYAIGQKGEGRMGTMSTRDSPIGQGIAPGEVVDFTWGPVRNEDPPIEILCVIFRDGAGDGDPRTIRDLNEEWAGHLAEKTRALPLLQAIAPLPEKEMGAAIDQLMADLQKRPSEENDPDHSARFITGMKQERQVLAQDLQRVREQKDSRYKTELTRIIEHYQAVSQR